MKPYMLLLVFGTVTCTPIVLSKRSQTVKPDVSVVPEVSWDDRPCLRGPRCLPGDRHFDKCLAFRERFVPTCKIDVVVRVDPVLSCLETCRSIALDYEVNACRPVCSWSTEWYVSCTESCRSVWP